MLTFHHAVPSSRKFLPDAPLSANCGWAVSQSLIVLLTGLYLYMRRQLGSPSERELLQLKDWCRRSFQFRTILCKAAKMVALHHITGLANLGCRKYKKDLPREQECTEDSLGSPGRSLCYVVHQQQFLTHKSSGQIFAVPSLPPSHHHPTAKINNFLCNEKW